MVLGDVLELIFYYRIRRTKTNYEYITIYPFLNKNTSNRYFMKCPRKIPTASIKCTLLVPKEVLQPVVSGKGAIW